MIYAVIGFLVLLLLNNKPQTDTPFSITFNVRNAKQGTVVDGTWYDSAQGQFQLQGSLLVECP